MKKALAILLAFALVGVFAFADVADIAVEGNATLTWGYDFNNTVNGFDNAAEWKISIPLMAKQTFGTKSEGDNYAEINIKDAQYMIEGKHDAKEFTAGDKKIDSMNASLHFGNVYMTVYDKPGFKLNNAEIWKPIKNDDYFADGKEGKALRFEPGFDGFGTKIGYKTDKFDVGVKVASLNTYKSREVKAADPTLALGVVTQAAIDDGLALDFAYTPITDPLFIGTPCLIITPAVEASNNIKSEYAFGVDVSATPVEMLTASASFNYATWARGTKATADTKKADGIMSLGFNVVAKPIADLEVKVAMDAGNDYVAKTNKDKPLEVQDVFAWDALASVKFKFVEAGTYVAAPGTAYAGTDKNGVKIMDLALFAKVTDGDFVENLDAWFTFMAYHLLSENAELAPKMPLPMAIGTGANYKYAMNDVNYVKPFVELYVQNRYKASNSTAVTKSELEKEAAQFAHVAKVGAEYGLFTNTTVTAQYATGATNDDKQNLPGLIKTSSKQDKGIFTLACKVKY